MFHAVRSPFHGDKSLSHAHKSPFYADSSPSHEHQAGKKYNKQRILIMEEFIDIDKITNRKLIIELRFDLNPLIFDKKGLILSNLNKLNIIKEPTIKTREGFIALVKEDSYNKELESIAIEIGRISYIVSNKINMKEFYDNFMLIFDTFKKSIDNLEFTRIGARIIATYKSSQNNFKEIIKDFKRFFPTQLLTHDYVPEDLAISINYKNGKYHLGPINKNDIFLTQQFSPEILKNEIGYGIDSDNFMIKTNTTNITDNENIKNVYLAAHAVQKDLFDKLNNM